MRRRDFLLLALATAFNARAQSSIGALKFSGLAAGAPLPDWLEPYRFPGRERLTEYSLVADEGRTVLRARADASTSGLIRTIRIDPRTHPVLAWRWKVMNLVEKGGLGTKAGDDFPARLYVTFDLDPDTLALGERMKLGLARALWGERMPLAALCYVWDRRSPAGTVAPNPYTDRVQMVVAGSGAQSLGRWVQRERNVDEDFRRAFGMPPPAVNGVIVSADTDNTGERTESYFGDVEFRARPTS